MHTNIFTLLISLALTKSEVLGLHQNIKEDIKLAFKKTLAFQCHPNKHPKFLKDKYGESKARSHMMKQTSIVDDLYRCSNDKTHKYCGSKAGSCHEESLNLVPVSLPFLVLHGEADQVTDKAISKQLHEVTGSSDKTLKLYPGMWHGLLYGEPPANLNIVFSDIIG
ncbi:hypothetical protein V8G54_016192 [Vigna mungo]|uniref:Serine aminopeptidase S33 domain-containing protein n=1 Tax=Vigna mungo TaxID=3915 RepID=A0AAQ3NNJ3_VIGMU